MTDGGSAEAIRTGGLSATGIVLGVAVIHAFTGAAAAEPVKAAFAGACKGPDSITVQIATPWQPVTGCITGWGRRSGDRTARFQALVPIRPASGAVALTVEPGIVVLTNTNGDQLTLSDFHVTDPAAPARRIDGAFFKDVIVSGTATATALEPGTVWGGHFMILENFE